MKVKIQRGELLKGLMRIQGVVERRNTMPILGHVFLETDSDNLTLFATDLEIGIKSAYPAKVIDKGAATVVGRKFYEIIRELPEGEVQLEALENHWISIEAGQSRFKVMGLPVQDYPVKPPAPQGPLFRIPHGILSELIQKTLFAVGENDTRYILNGVLLELRPAGGSRFNLRLVGTDGHRLAMIEREFESEQPGEALKGEISAIVPKKTLLEIKKLGEEEEEEPEMGFTKNQLLFRQGRLLLLSRLMEGTYPNYQQVIPKDNEKHIRVEKKPIEGALRRVSLLSREKTNAVKMQIEAGTICLSSNNPEIGEAREDLPIAYKGDGLSTGFNARYLLDVLGATRGDEVQFEFKDALSPCLIREPEDKDYLCVVMPMRV
jgi:DNA polymerase III subunit beta